MKAGVYRIKNLTNGKCYIGSSVCIRTRWQQHRLDLSKNIHHSPKLQRAWNKYSANMFVFEILLYCDPQDCLMYEQIALDHFKPEYNIGKVATAAMLGRKHTRSSKEKMSKALAGKTLSAAHRASISAYHADVSGIKNPFYGKKHSPDTKSKMSKPRPKTRGEKNHNSKLSDKQRIEVYQLGLDGLSERKRARLFGVTRGCVQWIDSHPPV
jgi:group I intron endonuclease